ncbi:MAG: hypothetical protein ACXABG_12755 [Promethearchaeota archaeon]|jgi:hypothetical protein
MTIIEELIKEKKDVLNKLSYTKGSLETQLEVKEEFDKLFQNYETIKETTGIDVLVFCEYITEQFLLNEGGLETEIEKLEERLNVIEIQIERINDLVFKSSLMEE